ncbi:MAG: SGNH/GDSL hydrolase family protein [Acidimicrobiales bacterium]
MVFGLQFDRLFEMLDAGTYTPDAFDTGYTGGLAARMRQLRRDQQTVNLSCPGESTATMIKGGCEYTLPEPDGPGLALHTDCEGPQLDAAVSFLRAHRRRVGPITVSIGGIDAAAPDAEIILVSFHNPFSISNPGTDRLWQRHYTAVQKGAARRNDVRVVDVAEIVNANNVCQLTFLCDSGDSHPTDAGYRRIAEQIFRVAGYRR